MASLLQKMFTKSAPSQVAPGLHRIQTAFVNAYLLGDFGGPFVLVDTGLYFSAEQIKKAVDDIFGVSGRPQAIVLTHGHFDHAGSVEELSRYWDVPVYAHPMEVPYLTGMSEYPPQDPTVGGFGGQMSRLYSNKPVNVAERIHQLPQDGSIPGLIDWKWIPTPGHSPGHISLFREKDGVLLAADALTTMNMRKMGEMVSQTPALNGPPEYFTADWEAALKSIDRLASLRPTIVASGHGEPLYYQGLELDLIDFADRYTGPTHGRYVGTPAHCDETGVVSLPPPVEDPLPKIVAGSAAGLLAAITTIGIFRNRRKAGFPTTSEVKGKKSFKVRGSRYGEEIDNLALPKARRREDALLDRRELEREKDRARALERARVKEWEKARAKREKEGAKGRTKAEAKAIELARQRAKEEEKIRAKAHEKAMARAKELNRERGRAQERNYPKWQNDLMNLFSKDKPAAPAKRDESRRVFGIFGGRAPKQKEKTGVLGIFSAKKAGKR